MNNKNGEKKQKMENIGKIWKKVCNFTT